MNEEINEIEEKIENLESKRERMEKKLHRARNTISLLKNRNSKTEREETQLVEIEENSKEMRESLGSIEERIAQYRDRMKELKERRVVDIIDEVSEEDEFGAHIDVVKETARERFGIESDFVDDTVERKKQEGDLEEFGGAWYSRTVKSPDNSGSDE